MNECLCFFRSSTQAPERATEVSTGGATPLHFCGMSRKGQLATKTVLKYIKNKADLEAVDTCELGA